ncbi:MAG: ABC transporter ATP-binding protein [Clostridiales bacterium]|nr:ABC transporter ATP-binding protein [Clostridiales bacterium]
MNTCENAIEIRGLGKDYPGFSLRDVSFSLPSGSILGLVGENGAGKSTTIKLLMNAIKPDAGRIRVLGADTGSPEFARVKEKIGVVLDEAYFPEVLSAKNVSEIMASTYQKWEGERYRQYLQRFNLPADKAFKDYSRGMRMKLAIAVALSHDPDLLVLDEATSGLDPVVRDEILDIFNDFTRDESHSILLSSHIVSDLEKICDYIAFLHNGRLLFCEEKDRLLEEYALVKLTRAHFEALDPAAVIGKKVTDYGVEALVKRNAIPAGMATEHLNLEDIILFLAKGDQKG